MHVRHSMVATNEVSVIMDFTKAAAVWVHPIAEKTIVWGIPQIVSLIFSSLHCFGFKPWRGSLISISAIYISLPNNSLTILPIHWKEYWVLWQTGQHNMKAVGGRVVWLWLSVAHVHATTWNNGFYHWPLWPATVVWSVCPPQLAAFCMAATKILPM